MAIADPRPIQSEPRFECLVPDSVAPLLLPALLRAYEDYPHVSVIVERRREERRSGEERRTAPSARRATGEERRRIRHPNGRRIGERRASQIPVSPLSDRADSGVVRFVERREPGADYRVRMAMGRLLTQLDADGSVPPPRGTAGRR